MKKLSIIFSSHFSDEENQKFIDHLKETAGVEINVVCIKNIGEFGLCEAYNKGWKILDEIGRGKDIIVFCHQDIVIRTKNWGKMLLGIFKNSSDYDIIGVAGSTAIYNGCWWLNETGKEMNFKNMYGSVYHTNGLREWLSEYNKCNGIKDVVLVDGLFIAVNGETIIHRFDENFKGFHFYDISFSIKNYLEGCNIGVVDRISILHKSIGQTNQEWENNRKQFYETYKHELPIVID